jgi:hypothetical protein
MSASALLGLAIELPRDALVRMVLVSPPREPEIAGIILVWPPTGSSSTTSVILTSVKVCVVADVDIGPLVCDHG